MAKGKAHAAEKPDEGATTAADKRAKEVEALDSALAVLKAREKTNTLGAKAQAAGLGFNPGRIIPIGISFLEWLRDIIAAEEDE